MAGNNKTQAGKQNFWANLLKKPYKMDEIFEALRKTELFRELNDKEISNLIESVHSRNYSPDEKIFLQDDPALAAFILLEGKVRLDKYIPDQPNEDRVVTPISLFGSESLLDDKCRHYSASAVNSCRCLVIFAQDYFDFCNRFSKEKNVLLARLKTIDNENIF